MAVYAEPAETRPRQRGFVLLEGTSFRIKEGLCRAMRTSFPSCPKTRTGGIYSVSGDSQSSATRHGWSERNEMR